MSREQRTIRFKGTVQGVGFRYTACRVADRYDVTGYVKNLSDGTVECVAEGEGKEIDAFIQGVQDQMGSHIRRVEQQSAPESGRFSGFGVSY
jgi:acylphosphatase